MLLILYNVFLLHIKHKIACYQAVLIPDLLKSIGGNIFPNEITSYPKLQHQIENHHYHIIYNVKNITDG